MRAQLVNWFFCRPMHLEVKLNSLGNASESQFVKITCLDYYFGMPQPGQDGGHASCKILKLVYSFNFSELGSR